MATPPPSEGLIMRHLLGCLLLACVNDAGAQAVGQDPVDHRDFDMDLMQAGPAWLVGDHVKARRHFQASSQRGNALAQYNLAMMMLNREGGPCDLVEAKALLRKAANAGVGLAREALEQMQAREAAHMGLKQPFRCFGPSQAQQSALAARPVQASAVHWSAGKAH